MNGWPITNYRVWQIKKLAHAAAGIVFTVVVAGNIAAAVFVKRVRVDPRSYSAREGFPFFVDAKEYIRLIREYPHDMGVGIRIHALRNGESYWDVGRRHGVSIDTIIAANPFLTSLVAREGVEIVVPLADGVLMPVDNVLDVYRMSRRLGSGKGARGNYIQSVFRIISPDEIRFAFFPDSRPYLVNRNLESLYNIRRIFQSPIRKGLYSSLYGDRVDPMREGMAFHNGVDIQVRMHTPIFPAREGMVSCTGWQDGYGLTVVVQHPDGYVTVYGHCSSVAVKKGDWVEKDTVIGRVGSTGRSTGPHLHFMMMRHGRMLNPLLFIW